MPSALVALLLVAATVVSLAASAMLVARLERICAWLGLSAALLGLGAALAADAPEVTSAVTALARGQQQAGTGVILGSNVFNLAALIGLGAVTAGGIALHRRSVLLEGGVALWIAAVTLAAVTSAVTPALALALALAALVPYVYISAAHPSARARVPAPAWLRSWLAGALSEEEQEISGLSPDRPGGRRDLGAASLALTAVAAASAVMEQAATTLGTRLAVPDAITGAIVLAAVTSLPNTVAAIYLARRGRAAATLSEAMNSNTLNIVTGLLIPAIIIGGSGLGTGLRAAAWYAALTLGVVALALAGRGVTRRTGLLIIYAYAVFVITVVITAIRTA